MSSAGLLQERPVRAEIALHYQDGRAARIDMEYAEVRYEMHYDDVGMSYEMFGMPVRTVARPARTTVTLTGFGETRFTLPPERVPEPTVASQRRNAGRQVRDVWADQRAVQEAELDLRQAQLDMAEAAERVRHARGVPASVALVSPATAARLQEHEPEVGPLAEPWYERDMDRGRWL